LTRLLFISNKSRWFFRLTMFTTLLAFLLIVLGTWNRLSGAALACPDWPLCYGHFLIPHTQAQISAITTHFPQFTFNLANVQIEMLLRYVLFGMTIAVVCMTCMSYRLQRKLSMQPFMLSLPILVAVMAEIFFNKLSATQPFHPAISLLNLIVELGIIGMLWWIGRISRPNSYSSSHPSLRQLRPWAWLAFLFLTIQVAFGGWINLSIADPACAHFPYCNIHLTPAVNWNRAIHPFIETSPENLASLHTAHRILAILAFFYLSAFSFMLVFNRYIYHLGFTLSLLLCVQFGLGFFKFDSLATTTAIMTQNTIVALLLLAVISLLTNLYNKPQDYLYG
jgi:heme A synthase